MPQLDPTWFASQLFWLFASFMLLYVILSRVILPPLMGIITQRSETISSDLSSAQSLKTQADQARQNYEQALAEARARSQQLMNDAMLEQKQHNEQLGKEMDQTIAAKLADAGKQISAKKKELLDALAPTSAELTGMIVDKLTSRAPSNDKIKSIIRDLSKVSR